MKPFVRSSVFCIVKYLTLLVLVFLSLQFIFNYFNLSYTDTDNARSLLSTMVESQAAIVAIVLSVSLVAIQLGAAQYSPRVIDIFKSDLNMWILLALYTVSILYDLIMLKTLNQELSDFYIFISYWLFASSFLALFPYTVGVINILRPEAILERLSRDVPASLKETKDPFRPIVDIITSSFIKYDYATVRSGLEKTTQKVIEVINSYDVEKDENRRVRVGSYSKSLKGLYREFSRNYCTHVKQVGKIFAEKDESLTLETIQHLQIVGQTVTKKKLGAEGDFVEVLGSIGEISVEQGFIEAPERIMNIIADIGKSVPYEDYVWIDKDGRRIASDYGAIINHVISAFRKIAIPFVRKRGIHGLQSVGRKLGEVGVATAEKGSINKWRIIEIARIFNDIGIIALVTEETPTHIRNFIVNYHVVEPLLSMAKIVHENIQIDHTIGVMDEFKKPIFALGEIGIYASAKGFYEVANKAAQSLTELMVMNEDVVEEILNSLGNKMKSLGYSKECKHFTKICKSLKGFIDTRADLDKTDLSE